jgi:hypothetical protein
MRSLVVLAGALALAVLALPATAAKRPPAELKTIDVAAARFSILGRWTGTLRQRGLKPFTVSATVRGFDALSLNTVHYSRIDCSGHWTYLTRSGFSYQFREVITSGKGGKCKGVGRVTLTRVDTNHVRYAFRGGGVVSRGMLRRAR